MTTFNFSLLTGETGPLVKGNTPEHVRIPIHGHTPLLKEGDQVLGGTKIASATMPNKGDMHSPLAGIIKAISHDAITITITGNEKADPQVPTAEGGEHLKSELSGLGVDVSHLRQASTLIINAVPPEPGISIFDPLLRDYRKTIELGLDTVQRIVNSQKMYLVAAKGNRANAFPNCTVTHVAPVHPNGMEPLVIKSVTGQEVLLGAQPEDAILISVKDLYFIGRIMETGHPVTETVMTIGTSNYLIRIGTPVGALLNEVGATAQPGDRVILGGHMRGSAALNLQQGVDKDSTGLQIVRPTKEGLVTNNPCIGCGECERHCPARIMPGMISRCSEFKYFSRAEEFHIHSCIECGICGYWCVAQRPLLHYIRLAKYELALLRSATSSIQAETPNETGENE